MTRSSRPTRRNPPPKTVLTTVEKVKAAAKASGTLSPEAAEIIRQDNATRAETPVPALPAMTDPAFTPAGTNRSVRIKKRISIPVLSFQAGDTIFCQFSEAIRVSEVKDDTFSTPARVAEIVSLEGEVRILIVGEVLNSELDRAYPDQGYVGLWFSITKLPPREGKRYSDYAIAEIEVA